MTIRLPLFLMALLCASGAHAADKKITPPSPALSVTTAQATRVSLPVRLSANGNIAAWQEAIIGSESNGLRLTEVKVNIGDTVKAGQLLARFSDESTQADVAQARANLMEAEASAADASGNAARARTLQDTGALSAQQINQYLTTEQTAKARVAAARATLDVQQVRLRHTRLVAPDSGIISARAATVGAVVPAGSELFRMIRQGRLEWRAEVISTELGRVHPGMAVSVVAANGSTLAGKVRMIAPTVDLQTRTALVYVDLQPASGQAAPARAGMFGRGDFALGNSNALTVPQQAVVVRDGFSYVFRLNADQHVSQLKVTPGRRLAERIELLDGVTPDMALVVTGAGFLNDGDLVSQVSAAAPATR
ncbi:efflux RND transporter periplasmic adaptor subunit [Actimicrobium sp. CCI2.3]|uniref:efflux RND transporter periplasmic adaptor subunit n=1 Tax=Actimicrobium sp. CCI2.3 TaxID=3048616 RepID=UPI002AB46DC5|nr:efflux RND transporter periplasmic adaptor subunit [Actimicrobium sp. CCI2.3]MDY7576613.1 efflux RND transporter periplasmic adaptor subunit [Actimicrobium sp. CCI2.3]MEB0021214.1 efflux RND transporter periplasmic adaptor subunit [Actimicrobium sp. CCI2.3]